MDKFNSFDIFCLFLDCFVDPTVIINVFEQIIFGQREFIKQK